MRRKPPLFGCFCGGVATASPLKANIQSDETAEYTVPLDDVVHITAGAPAESQQVVRMAAGLVLWCFH
jgi:hypothetical protein